MVRILIGSSVANLMGGVYVAEKAFQDECAKNQEVVINTFRFGRRSDSETTIHKIIERSEDLVRYAVLLRKEKPDIVHLNSAYDKRGLLRDVWYVAVSRIFRRNLFIKFHGSDATLLMSDSGVWSWLTRQTVSNVSAIGVLSSEEKSNFLQAGFPKEKFFVVKNVVNCQRFSVRRISPAQPQLLFIGRFISSKGLTDVIRATRLVIDAGRNVRLVCIGDGPQRQEAQALVERMGMGSVVTFTGYITEEATTPYYLGSSMLVFPTHHQEGFSMTLFQSVAAGLPIITTKARAAADYLKEPDNCLWVEPGNPSMLAEKIIYLVEHPEVRENMSCNNKGLAEHFTADKVANEFLEIYRHLLDKN
jgi:glycosyltransferase involved in cell wall biosynthesis